MVDDLKEAATSLCFVDVSLCPLMSQWRIFKGQSNRMKVNVSVSLCFLLFSLKAQKLVSNQTVDTEQCVVRPVVLLWASCTRSNKSLSEENETNVWERNFSTDTKARWSDRYLYIDTLNLDIHEQKYALSTLVTTLFIYHVCFHYTLCCHCITFKSQSDRDAVIILYLILTNFPSMTFI